jgi:indolepyruvate ferredoxin oxidoreductase
MAAHLEDKGCTTMDQTGLAQKGGAVTSHIRLAKTPEDIHTVRIGIAGADIILGCDMLVTADGDSLSKILQDETKVILNTHKAQTGEFTQKPDWRIPEDKVLTSINALCGEGNLLTLRATKLATALMGDSIATNMFVLGYAYQMGFIPLMEASILRALELNGASIKMNQNAFMWGRRAAFNMAKVTEIAMPVKVVDDTDRHRELSKSPEERVERRVVSLTGYQSAAYAKKYLSLIKQVQEADIKLNGTVGKLTEAAAKYYYKLMAYKDEYEVARLYTDGQFLAQLKHDFEGEVKLKFNLAPPLLAKRDPETGQLKKQEFGAWILPVFKGLAKMKMLRGTPLDIFGYTAERKMERQLVRDYKKLIEGLLPKLTATNYDVVVELASLPEHIRGYGHVKEKHFTAVKKREAELLSSLSL